MILVVLRQNLPDPSYGPVVFLYFPPRIISYSPPFLLCWRRLISPSRYPWNCVMPQKSPIPPPPLATNNAWSIIEHNQYYTYVVVSVLVHKNRRKGGALILGDVLIWRFTLCQFTSDFLGWLGQTALSKKVYICAICLWAICLDESC